MDIRWLGGGVWISLIAHYFEKKKFAGNGGGPNTEKDPGGGGEKILVAKGRPHT